MSQQIVRQSSSRSSSINYGGETPDFWRRVSQQLSYIDVSGRSSLSQSPQQQRGSSSWHQHDDTSADDVGATTSLGGTSDNSSVVLLVGTQHHTRQQQQHQNYHRGGDNKCCQKSSLDRPPSIASFHSNISRPPASRGFPSLTSLHRPHSDSGLAEEERVNCLKFSSRIAGTTRAQQQARDSVVETDGFRAATTKIHKRLSFGDILDTQTNIYTPEDEIPLSVQFSDGNKSPAGAPLRGWAEDAAAGPSKSNHFNGRKYNRIVSSFANARPQVIDGLYNYIVEKDLRYFFQHPWPRLFITYFVIFCNFLIFAEDPVSHSHTESNIPVVGNVFSFVLTKYPPEWYWSTVKVLMWLLAILCGMVLGKLLIHGLFFAKLLRLKMFRDDQGSWMTMFLTVIVALYLFSHAYNMIIVLWYDKHREYKITSAMGVTNASAMKAAACGTWLGDLITALMVTDMMLQDNLYPGWATAFRKLWRRSNVPRILIFWVGSVVATAVVVTLIVSDWISWDRLNKDFVATTEISRAFLASFVLVMDLLIVMQDWDFPHFTTTMHVNLPGFSVASLQWKYAELTVSGKWFNYGIIFMVLILDLNMWKNQIFYDPVSYGQYTGPDDKVWTVNDKDILSTGNSTLWTWDYRSQINPNTSKPYYEDDMQMNSRHMGYPLSMKWTAFIPNVVGFILFFALITRYGRFPENKESRLGKRNGRRSSWRRERGQPASPSTLIQVHSAAAAETLSSREYKVRRPTSLVYQPKDDDAL